jgi:hypothetical protein
MEPACLTSCPWGNDLECEYFTLYRSNIDNVHCVKAHMAHA